MISNWLQKTWWHVQFYCYFSGSLYCAAAVVYGGISDRRPWGCRYTLCDSTRWGIARYRWGGGEVSVTARCVVHCQGRKSLCQGRRRRRVSLFNFVFTIAVLSYNCNIYLSSLVVWNTSIICTVFVNSLLHVLITAPALPTLCYCVMIWAACVSC